MRSEYIRIYKIVHTWTGILTGLALFIAFYAGALTVFKEPLARWASPPAATTHLPKVPLEAAPALIARTLTAHPAAARGFELNLHPDESSPAPLHWLERESGEDDHDMLAGRHYRASLSADGEALVEAHQPSQLAELIDILHRVVGLPFDNDPSRWLMGVIACLYALALFSGVVVLLPSLIKDFFALRVGKNVKRMWLDAHNIVGIVSLPFHIVMAVTAVVFAYHDGFYELQNRFIHAGKLANAFNAAAAKPAEKRDPASLLPPARLLERVREIAPSFTPSHLQYAGLNGPRATVRVWGHDDKAVSPRALGGFVAFEPYTGKVLSTDFLPGHQDAANLTISSFFALHMASFGGPAVRWLYFALGLAGAWLFYSGNLLWIESRRKRRPGQDSTATQPVRRDTRWLAAGTVGVCFGCIAGISLTMTAGKWLHGRVADLNAWHWYIYYAVFLGSCAWAFLRGPALAALELPKFAAATTLLIPLTSLIGWLAPALGPWARASTLAVDATALAGALALMAIARASTRRILDSPEDSVWHWRRSGTPCAALLCRS